MDETITSSGEAHEQAVHPVEIKFGDVIQPIGKDSSRISVVINPENEDYIRVSRIISDDDSHPVLGGPGTLSDPASVVGSWPLEKIVTVYRNEYGTDAESMMKDLAEFSQSPSVMYKGVQ